MSHLALLSDNSSVEEQPRIISFLDFANQHSVEKRTAGERARLERKNQCCPICNRVTVEVIELNNGRIGRNGRMIPGTGSLVGFSCNACGHEWPV